MDTPDIEWEKEVHTFVNELAMQLTPSNDTMNAVRLIRKDLPDFISYMRTSHTTYWKEQLQKTREEERERIVKLLDWRGKGFHSGSEVVTWIDEQLQALTPNHQD